MEESPFGVKNHPKVLIHFSCKQSRWNEDVKDLSPHLYVRACRLFYLLGLSAGSEQWRSSHCSVVWQSSALLAVDTIPLKESKRGLIMMLNWMYDSQGGTLNLITQLRLIKIGFKCKRPRGIKKCSVWFWYSWSLIINPTTLLTWRAKVNKYLKVSLLGC